jgi:hypothetical protein
LTGAPQQHRAAERPASLAARGRFHVVQWLRAVPIRWRILSIAGLNSAVVVVLAVLIWNGTKVLDSAWDDVRQVRESDKILALLESETSRLQNLIHRYINQPSPELFAEILLLRGGAGHSPAPRPTMLSDRWRLNTEASSTASAGCVQTTIMTYQAGAGPAK